LVKRISIFMLAFMFLALSASAQKWEVEKVHSSVGFSVKHLVISKVKGNFKDFSGTINFDGKNWDKASAEMTVMMGSVDTDDEKRDAHLKSADFFDTETFPEMSFKSKKVIKGEGDAFKLVGDLTIRGVTKEVTFDCEFNGVADFMGTTKAGFSAKAKINRQDYGVNWNKTLDTGGVVVGNEVEIYLELEANKVG